MEPKEINDDVRIQSEQIQANLLRFELSEKRRVAEARSRAQVRIASIVGLCIIILLLGVGSLVLSAHDKKTPEFISTALNIAMTGFVAMTSYHSNPGRNDDRKDHE